ncbi:unnamed protein product [marine sediment metagenome]|uniref:Ribbon-helix-helix protein CopG domain-containing protein n=1 Tax=marine sediment metagenome TaxID=412755 RepID=X0U6W9_9ZZZZ
MSKHPKHFRLEQETDEELIKISQALGFDKSKVIRMLVNRGIKKLKQDALKVGGLENLEISVKEVL